MAECVFCRIVEDQTLATVVRAWDDALCIVPLDPVVQGHLLVLPKEHVETFFSSPDVSAATMRRTAELLHGVERWVEPRDHNVITSAGRAATQTVMHLHIHLVPRRANDGLTLPWTPENPKVRLADDLAEAVRAHKRYWPRVDWGSERCERRLFDLLEQHAALSPPTYSGANPDPPSVRIGAK